MGLDGHVMIIRVACYRWESGIKILHSLPERSLNLKLQHCWTSNFPTRRKFIVLPSHHNEQRPPPSLNEWPVSSLSTNCWHPPSLVLASSLSQWMASFLSQQMAGIHPLSTNGCPSTFDNGLILPLADGLPCLDEKNQQYLIIIKHQFVLVTIWSFMPEQNILALHFISYVITLKKEV